jgi:hypothetical protein
METWTEAIEAFNDTLDGSGDNWPEVAGLTFAPSRILRTLYPAAYRDFLVDFLDVSGVDTDTLTGDYPLANGK